MSHKLVRNRCMSNAARENVDSLMQSILGEVPEAGFRSVSFQCVHAGAFQLPDFRVRIDDHATGAAGNSPLSGAICPLALLEPERGRGIAKIRF